MRYNMAPGCVTFSQFKCIAYLKPVGSKGASDIRFSDRGVVIVQFCGK
jgi:hypothetical protein